MLQCCAEACFSLLLILLDFIKHIYSIFHLFTFMSSVNLKILNGALEIRYLQRWTHTTVPPGHSCVYLSVSFSQIDGFKHIPWALNIYVAIFSVLHFLRITGYWPPPPSSLIRLIGALVVGCVVNCGC